MTTSEIRCDNKTVIDLKKVLYARLFYRTQKGLERGIKPTKHTLNGQVIFPDELALAHPDYPNETCLARARRLDILDKWMPVWKAVMHNGHTIEFTWSKARAMDQAWREYIFNRKKK